MMKENYSFDFYKSCTQHYCTSVVVKRHKVDLDIMIAVDEEQYRVVDISNRFLSILATPNS